MAEAPAGAGYRGRCARNIPVPATAASVELSALAEEVTGWSFREVTGAASADIQIMDGTQNTGDTLAEITLSPGESIRDDTGAYPLLAERGVFLQVNAGTVRGSVWARRA